VGRGHQPARRLLATRHAVALSSLASGFVSSTATIASMGLAARSASGSVRALAGGGLLSCVSTQLQLLLVAAAVRPAWLASLWLPALAAAALALVWGWWLVRGDHGEVALGGATPRSEALPAPSEDRMFSLGGALVVALLLAAIQALVYGLRQWLGDAGLIVGAVIGALADLHASAAAVFSDAGPSNSSLQALMLVLLVHAASKSVTALASGGWAYLGWLAPGLWLHTLLGVGLLAGWG
jgi:uncharacterized membrane protein (DUF4010 family)